MEYIDKEIDIKPEGELTKITGFFEDLIQSEDLVNANIFCWLPHEVSSLVLAEADPNFLADIKDYLAETIPAGKWVKHDEPNTPFRFNAHEHIRTKVIGHHSLTLLIKDAKIWWGKYQDLYLYNPVYRHKSNKIFVRIMKF
ncbi:MAG TPA: YjbQ family protein [bacterium]|mgnify:CR=1 FL=1|nr:YjbQ family protein [bacterium]